jgi:alginate O-acetyltransferase complex protein AlgJ
MKNKLLIVAAFLAVAAVIQWLITPLCVTLPSSLSLDIARLPSDSVLKLSYDIGTGYNETLSCCVQAQQSNLPSKLVFQLPADIQLSGLKFDMPQQQGDITISGMDFGDYHWSPLDIEGSFMMNADIGMVEADEHSIDIHATGNNPSFSSVGSLEYVYSYLTTKAVAIRAAVFLVSLLVFFVVVTLLNKRRYIDQKAALTILRSTVFFSVCILLLIPSAYTVLTMLNQGKTPIFAASTVNEKKPDIPQFSWDAPDAFLRDVELYFSKTYALRHLFIRWHCTLSTRLLGESPVPMVIAGKDGWLFGDLDGSLDDHRGMEQLNEQELNDIKLKWTYIKNYLDSKGVYLLVVFAPDKETIYPEYLPARLGPFVESTRLDQVIAEISTIPGLEYVDLRGTLKSAKEQGLLYYNVNSHWTALGAFIGYQELLSHLGVRFDEVNVPGIESVTTEKYAHCLGGYPQMMIMSGEYPDNQVQLTVQTRSSSKIRAPSLLIFHDSFANAMLPYFEQDFETVVSAGLWHRFDTQMVEREQPDAVIFIMVERGSGENLLPTELK